MITPVYAPILVQLPHRQVGSTKCTRGALE